MINNIAKLLPKKTIFQTGIAGGSTFVFQKLSIMSIEELDAFIESAGHEGTLTSEGVISAVVSKQIPINGLHSWHGYAALHFAVQCERRELVVALLAAGADANVQNDRGATSVWWGALQSTADILQLLIDGGGSVNNVDNFGRTPLIALVMYKYGDVPARLQVLLACADLDLDAEYDGKTAEEWATMIGKCGLEVMIADERMKRQRWSVLRAAWVAAAVTAVTATMPDAV